MNQTSRFWKRKSLEEMSPEEWESLCDGCGKCCLHAFEYEDTGALHRVRVACRLLDTESCRCSNYDDRFSEVPDCVLVTPELARRSTWLPETCAYRLVAHGRDLPWWHPLVSGDPETVHEAGISVRGKVISERDVHPDEIAAAPEFEETSATNE